MILAGDNGLVPHDRRVIKVLEDQRVDRCVFVDVIAYEVMIPLGKVPRVDMLVLFLVKSYLTHVLEKTCKVEFSSDEPDVIHIAIVDIELGLLP